MPVVAAGSVPPSMELLLYLSEWPTDERGQLTDPLDVPVEVDQEVTTELVPDSDGRLPFEEVEK